MKRIVLAAVGLLAAIALSTPQVSAQNNENAGAGKIKNEKREKSSRGQAAGQDRPAARKSSQGPAAERKTVEPRERSVGEAKREKPRKAMERADQPSKKSGTAARGGGSGEQGNQAERDDQTNRAEGRDKRQADQPSQGQDRAGKREARQPESAPEKTPETTTGKANERDRPATEAEQTKDRPQRDEPKDQEAAQQEREKSNNPKAVEYRQRVSEVERTKVVQAIERVNLRRHDRRDINIRISVGVILPRTVEFYEWPEEVLVLVPAYRYYRYILIEDEICIVDPDTRVIVDVIDRNRFRDTAFSGGAILELSRQEELLILARIDVRRERSGTGIDLQIGRPLPGSIEFREFPDDIVREVPKVRPYRYAVVDDEIAIVAPRSADVVRIIKD